MSKISAAENDLSGLFQGRRRISARFRNINIALLAVVSLLMAATMLESIRDVTKHASADYARLYTSNTAGALGAHLNREIGLLTKAAHSNALREWLNDEDDPEKKRAAFEEMRGIIDALFSNNLYIGLERTGNEYAIEEDSTLEDLKPRGKLDPDNPKDVWFFDGLAADRDYVLKADIDKIMHRKRVWLNYKVARAGQPLGIVSSGLEFAHVAAALFSEYDNTRVRSLIMDANGIIHMDSSLLGHDDFLNFSFEIPIGEISSDPAFLAAVKKHLSGINGYFELRAKPMAVELSSGQYGYATIAPIVSTDWSVVTLFKSASPFDLAKLMPFSITMAVLIVLFVLISGIISHRLLLVPFEKLIHSLRLLKEDRENLDIYGIDRNDEFGILSSTILDLFTESQHDTLTGLYNRRALEQNLKRYIEYISRLSGRLTVLMIDVDFLKKFNETYGRDQGDDCLKAIADALSRGLKRADDLVARYSGEEFVALLPGVDEQGARLVAERLRQNVLDLGLPHEQGPAGFVSISVGVTTGQVAYTHDWNDYLKRADEALYMAKQNGRNQCIFLVFSEEPK